MKPIVLSTQRVPGAHLAPLDGLAEVQQPPGAALFNRDEVLARAAPLVGIISLGELRVDAELIDAAPALKIVANTAIGTDNLDLETLADRGIWATNSPDAFTESTADITLALILCAARKVAAADRFVRGGGWGRGGVDPARWEGLLLAGKTLGIVGYGNIGRAVARRAEAFGLRVVHHRRTPTGEPGYRSLDDLLSESDIVSLHTPHTPETHRLIDRAALARMKPGAILVNVARGKVVDEAALVEALAGGHLAGAGLDVFEEEPAVHPGLLEMDQVVLTPHIGGAAREARRDSRIQAAENVARVLRGEDPLTPVGRPVR